MAVIVFGNNAGSSGGGSGSSSKCVLHWGTADVSADGSLTAFGNTANTPAGSPFPGGVVLAPFAGTLQFAFSELLTAPGLGNQVDLIIRVNATPVITVSFVDAATTASDIVATGVVAAGDEIDVLVSLTGTPAASGVILDVALLAS